MRVGVVAAAALLFAACQESSPPLAPSFDQPSAPPFARASVQRLPGQYIVVFRRDVKDVRRDATRLAGLHRGRVNRVYESALKGMALSMSDEAAAALRSDPSVAYVEPDQVAHIVADQPNATWGLDRVDQPTGLSGSYRYFANGSGVHVYIIDTGLHLGHAEFAGRVESGFDAVTAGGTGADCNGHGTHVAGTVGGAQYGVAKNVSLHPVRVLGCSGNGSYSQVIAGIDWVTANHLGPAVANVSLGGGFSQALNDAVAASISSGVTYAVAAGNGDGSGVAQDACNASPSSTPSALTVGATNISDRQASFSNHGSCVDLQAPGVNIKSAWFTGAGATNTISGTSMAAPHVAGAAALYLATFPSASPADVARALTSNATPGAVSGLQSGTPNLLLYTGFIGSSDPPPPPPPSPVLAAAFTYSCSNLVCGFDARASGGTSSSTIYRWTFGDGKSGQGPTISHKFPARRSYTVRLTLREPGKTNNSTSKAITCNGQRCS